MLTIHNVPGSYSSNKGKDFQSVLEAVIGIAEPNAQVPMPEKARWPYADLYMGNGWSVAYRTLDAELCEASHNCAYVQNGIMKRKEPKSCISRN